MTKHMSGHVMVSSPNVIDLYRKTSKVLHIDVVMVVVHVSFWT